MGNVTFEFRGMPSENARVAAEAVAKILAERGHLRGGPYWASKNDADDAAEALGEFWTVDAVEKALENCEFFGSADAVADQYEMFRLVHALEAENLALRSDLGLLQKQINGVLARVKVLEGALADNAKA
jgi:hypothetical protein